jgi:hypothetical protein
MNKGKTGAKGIMGFKMIDNPQDYIDQIYQDWAKEKMSKKPRDKWKKKIYTNWNYDGRQNVR